MFTSEFYGQLRPRAFAIAYRMLGSVSEAEDVVQDAFLKMHHTLRRDEQITSPRAYIATLVTRLAIDQLRSARIRRERYVGEWLPEPVLTEPTPAEHAETADSLSLAFLVLLESLSPRQRAAFLLREVFEYPYPEVAEVIGTDVDSTRQLVARARHHVRHGRPRYYASRRQREALAARFSAAADQGGRVRFAVDGGYLDDAIRALTQFGIRSLTSHPPTLEELMLRHYGDELAAVGNGNGEKR